MPKKESGMDTPSLESLSEELHSLRLLRFDYEFVWELGDKLRQTAKKQGAAVAIQIRHGEDVVFSTLLPGATNDNFDWTRRKCAVAHRFQKSSLAVRLEAEAKGHDFNQRFRLSPADFAASGGGIPLILSSGAMIGTAAVSGLPDVDDHVLLATTLKSIIQ